MQRSIDSKSFMLSLNSQNVYPTLITALAKLFNEKLRLKFEHVTKSKKIWANVSIKFYFILFTKFLYKKLKN